jgi:hypothetical protein
MTFPSLQLHQDTGFADGTLVHAQRSLAPIESLRVGDLVLSQAPGTPAPGRRRAAQEYVYRPVIETQVLELTSLVRVQVLNHADGLINELLMAPDQPVFTLQDGWLAARQLGRLHAVVLSFNGNATVEQVAHVNTPTRVHALRVAEFGSYYVQGLGTWVHEDAGLAPAETPLSPMQIAMRQADPNKEVSVRIADNYFNDTLMLPAIASTSPSPRPSPPQSRTAMVAPQPEQPSMANILDALRSRFTARQQRMNAVTLPGVLAARPPWMQDDDALSEIYARQALLLSQGRVSWAALIMANQLMFQPGNTDCPGMLVHAAGDYFDAHPNELHVIARCIGELKSTDPADPQLLNLAKLLRTEMDRGMSVPLPGGISDRPLLTSTFMLMRKHIPGGVMGCRIFPILSHPDTPAVMMLPFEFWPIELIVMAKERQL